MSSDQVSSDQEKQQGRFRDEQSGLAMAIVLALVWIAAVAAIRPLDGFPLFDDWVYSWSAFRLATDRSMTVPEWSSVYPLAHAAWGALFVSVFGAADWTLRLSTVGLAAVGHLCWYRMLRAFGVRRSWAVVAVAAVAFHPVYFLLTLSFMTDVPMVAWWQIGLYAAWRWLDDDNALWQLAAVASGLASAYARQTGAALLVGLLVTATARRARNGRAREALLPLAAICMVVAGVFVFGAELGEALPMTARLADVLMVVRVPVWLYVDGLAVAAAFVGLSVAPFAFARGDDRWFVGAAVALFGVWIVGEAPGLRTGSMWGACELGGTASLLTARPAACAWQLPARAAALVAAALGWSALGPVLVGHFVGTARGSRPRASAEFQLLVVATFVVFALGLAALWLFTDRYWLAPAVLAPALLVVDTQARRLGSLGRTAAALLAYALVAVLGTSAVFDFYRDVDAARVALLAEGVAPDEIDAGYAQNGRYRYLALPAAPTHQGRNRDIPWVSGIAVSEHTITNGAAGPRVVAE